MRQLRSVINTVQFARDLRAEYTRELQGEPGRYDAHVIDHDDRKAVQESRMLAARVLQAHGVVSDEIVTRSGGIEGYLENDPHHKDSVYFQVTDRQGENPSRAIAATRLILGNANLSNLRQPIQQINGHIYDALVAMPQGTVAELGSTSKESGTSNIAVVKLMRTVLGYAASEGIDVLVSGIQERIWEKAYGPLYHGAMTRMSDSNLPPRSGGQQERVPIWLHVPTVLTNRAASLRDREPWWRPDRRSIGELVLDYYGLDPAITPNHLGLQDNPDPILRDENAA